LVATLENIPNYNYLVVVRLEGTSQTDEIVVFDEFNFYTPLDLYVSLYLSQITTNTVVLSMYLESSVISEISYKAILYNNSRKIQEKVVNPDQGSSETHFEGIEVEFIGLKAGNVYSIVLEATYTNPYTLESTTAIVGSESFETLNPFTSSVSIVKTENEYLVTITLFDPAHNFQKGYYLLYVIEDSFEMNYGGTETDFIPNGDQKTTEIVISIPTYENYRIEIGVRNQTDYVKYVVLENIKP
jgi:hypothetical protein